MKTKKKRIFLIILIVLLLLIALFFIEVGVKSKACDKEIEAFKERGEYDCTIGTVEYYKVIKKYDYEDVESRIVNKADDRYIGTTGDVYVLNTDPLGTIFTEELSRKLWFGHSGIVYSSDAKKVIEVVGNVSKEENIVKEYYNDWYEVNIKEFAVLRVKGTNETDKENIKTWCDEQKGKKYNYFFVAHLKDAFYCLDIASRAYQEIGKDIDGNFNITLGSDMISDDDTYLIYYKEIVYGVDLLDYRVYYLCGE